MVPSRSNTKMSFARTLVLSVLAPGLMKTRLVPGTRIETCPNMPIVPCRPSIRDNVAVFSRNTTSSLMKTKTSAL